MIHIPVAIIGLIAISFLASSCQNKEADEQKAHDKNNAFVPVIPPPDLNSLRQPKLDTLPNPFETSPELEDYTLKVVASAATKEEKAKAIHDAIISKDKLWVLQNTDSKLRPLGAQSAVRVFNGVKGIRYAQCLEYAVLFVTMARIAGLNANVALVDRNAEGEMIDHACAIVGTERGKILVDPWNKEKGFDIKHQDFKEIDDKKTLAVWLVKNSVIFQDTGKNDISNRSLYSALELWPTYSAIYNQLGNMASRETKPELAKSFYNKAIQLNQNDYHASYNLAYVYHDKGTIGIAIHYLNKTIEINPRHENAHIGLGVIYTNRNELESAITEFEKTLEINPKNVIARNNLANIYKQQGFPDGAIEEYKKAIEHNPKHPDLHFNLGVVYASIGDEKSARIEYIRTIGLNPRHSGAHCNLGNIYEHGGNYHRALEEHKKAVEIEPNNPGFHENLARVYQHLGEKEKADEALQKAKRLRKD